MKHFTSCVQPFVIIKYLETTQNEYLLMFAMKCDFVRERQYINPPTPRSAYRNISNADDMRVFRIIVFPL